MSMTKIGEIGAAVARLKQARETPVRIWITAGDMEQVISEHRYSEWQSGQTIFGLPHNVDESGQPSRVVAESGKTELVQ